MNQLFKNTGKLEVLDLGDKFNVSNVTNANSMFYDDYEHKLLKTVLSKNDLVFPTEADVSLMFRYAKSIVGGKGTLYNNSLSNHGRYALIDCGTKRPGYLTYKGTAEEYEAFCSQFD